ncbi:MAG: hypothetical protein ACFHVJ_01665 [Aestuariibacter sp.]
MKTFFTEHWLPMVNIKVQTSLLTKSHENNSFRVDNRTRRSTTDAGDSGLRES